MRLNNLDNCGVDRINVFLSIFSAQSQCLVFPFPKGSLEVNRAIIVIFYSYGQKTQHKLPNFSLPIPHQRY